jgi:S-DNA-T family DNA segregation ATPase FtsK/SpoIIIE
MAIVQNTYKQPSEPIQKPPRRFLPSLSFSMDHRFKVALGIFLQALTFFLLIAFISHLLHGRTDQSTIESISEIGVRAAGKAIHNWLGIVGAMVSYYLMFRWFGITAFLLLPPLYLLGARLLYSRIFSNWNLFKATVLSLMGIFWLNTALGYLALFFPHAQLLSSLLGGLAFELGTLADSLLGWGTVIALLASGAICVVYVFHVTTLPSIFRFLTPRATENLSADNAAPMQHVREFPSQTPAPMLDSDAAVSQEVAAEEIKEEEYLEPIYTTNIFQPTRASHTREVPLSVVNDRHIQEGNGPRLQVVENHNLDPHPVAAEHATEVLADYDPKLDLAGYQYPTLDLLEDREPSKKEVTQEELEQNKDKIVRTLTDFKIGIASIKATIGPTVTLYEIIPEAGVKISKIKNLEDDIALSLAALGIRIIAPIPGKGTIGIEVPNKNREMVPFRDMLTSDKFTKSNMELPIILGKSISNEPIIVDMVRMPHVLIAGATGQGKSVGLNVLLVSLIYKKHPSQLKLVLVDPKKVELSLYSHLERHFLAKLPGTDEAIITETKKVVNTLNSLCLEMDLRYDLLKQAGTRNIKEYNDKFVKRRLNPANGHRFLPYIVLVIDEFADMMMTAGKEVEIPIARLAQLARAIGIHLVLATQRPSVNVITGIIKANFPVRISFRVTSKIDSRTILDAGGAEQLVGQGDMLLSMNSSIIRLQSPFLGTQEIENICDFIGAQRGYESAYLLPEYEADDEHDKLDFEPGEQDPLFEEAARLIVAHQQGSTSLIQRKLKLGYNRAGRLIDQLEAAGIVGPFEGSKARDVLIPDERSLEMLLRARQEVS